MKGKIKKTFLVFKNKNIFGKRAKCENEKFEKNRKNIFHKNVNNWKRKNSFQKLNFWCRFLNTMKISLKWKRAIVVKCLENQVQLATKARNNGCSFPGGISGPRHRHGEHPADWFEKHSEWRCQALKLKHVTPKFLMDSKAQPTLWQSPEGLPMMSCKLLVLFEKEVVTIKSTYLGGKLGKGKSEIAKVIIFFLRKIIGFLTKIRQQKTQNFVMNSYSKFFELSERTRDHVGFLKEILEKNCERKVESENCMRVFSFDSCPRRRKSKVNILWATEKFSAVVQQICTGNLNWKNWETWTVKKLLAANKIVENWQKSNLKIARKIKVWENWTKECKEKGLEEQRAETEKNGQNLRFDSERSDSSKHLSEPSLRRWAPNSV